MNSSIDIGEWFTTTRNGSKVIIRRRKEGVTTAWQHIPTYADYAYIRKLNKLDIELVNSLGLPNWYHDFTGEGMVLPLHKQEYVAKKLKEALDIQTPYKDKEDELG